MFPARVLIESIAQPQRIILLLASMCLLLGACMSSPRTPVDLSEYTLDSPGFPVRRREGAPRPAVHPVVREGHLAVTIDGAGHQLQTLTVSPPGDGPFPLALISHGIPRERSLAPSINLRRLLPVARNFARRGYRAVAFARRGFGSSTGTVIGNPTVPCGFWPSRAYIRAADASADDYAAVQQVLIQLPEVDASKVVAIGQSVGGLTVLALAARRPPGLIGVVNFAGGHGANGRRQVCNAGALRRAFTAFGRSAQVPTLWLYSTVDRYFWPSLTRRNFDAYTAAGAPARLAMVGPLWHAPDGHQLVELGGRELWQPQISAFLRDIGAPGWHLDPTLAVVPRPTPPPGLDAPGRRAWLRYLGSAGHKAFAVGDDGWGWAIHRRSRPEAEEAAIGFCAEHSNGCRVVAADGDPEASGDGRGDGQSEESEAVPGESETP